MPQSRTSATRAKLSVVRSCRRTASSRKMCSVSRRPPSAGMPCRLSCRLPCRLTAPAPSAAYASVLSTGGELASGARAAGARGEVERAAGCASGVSVRGGGGVEANTRATARACTGEGVLRRCRRAGLGEPGGGVDENMDGAGRAAPRTRVHGDGGLAGSRTRLDGGLTSPACNCGGGGARRAGRCRSTRPHDSVARRGAKGLSSLHASLWSAGATVDGSRDCALGKWAEGSGLEAGAADRRTMAGALL
mmetsp:Transcript_52931/g.133114  ORF Transcript_52931/g.133114 Transcript_52931/m.133114 type:complete len:249 (+) Transcript_52931:1003-1749(+)